MENSYYYFNWFLAPLKEHTPYIKEHKKINCYLRTTFSFFTTNLNTIHETPFDGLLKKNTTHESVLKKICH